MKLFFTLLIVFFSFESYGQCSEPLHPDYEALVTFYNQTGGDSWTFNTGWKEGVSGTSCDPCDFEGSPWLGLVCTNGRVTCMDMDGTINCLNSFNNGYNITGNIPSEIGDLSELTVLSLSNNNLTGSIPMEIGSLTKLRRLTMANNNLSGIIPASIGNLKSLIGLRLHFNNISGEIPNELSQLDTLQTLWLYNNELSGPLPEWIGDSKDRLMDIRLSSNDLSGCYPENYVNICDRTINFQNNDLLPWSGSMEEFCLTDGKISGQVGAPCDDGIADNGTDVINTNCNCGPNMVSVTDKLSLQLEISPNPGSNYINVVGINQSSIESICFINSAGNKFKIDKDNLDVSFLRGGLYIMVVKMNNEVEIKKKFVKI